MQSAWPATRQLPPSAHVGSTQHSPASWLHSLLARQPARPVFVVVVEWVVVVVVVVVEWVVVLELVVDEVEVDVE
jgi:hypothetical protein